MANKNRKVDVDGQTYLIPAINRIATEKERMILTEFICKVYSSNKYRLNKVCKMAGINHKAFYNWRRDFPVVANMYAEALAKKKEIYSEGLTDLAMTAAERLLSTDYQVKRTIKYNITGAKGEVIHRLYDGEKIDLNGEYDIEVTEVIEPNKQNAMITMAVLYNGMKGQFDRNPTPDGNGIEKENKALIEWVGGHNDKEVDLTEEIESFED